MWWKIDESPQRKDTDELVGTMQYPTDRRVWEESLLDAGTEKKEEKKVDGIKWELGAAFWMKSGINAGNTYSLSEQNG